MKQIIPISQYAEDLHLYKNLHLHIEQKKADWVELRTPKIGSSIHLFSRSGTYKVKAIGARFLTITTNKWITEFSRGQRKSPDQLISPSDFKCYEGSPFSHPKHKIIAGL